MIINCENCGTRFRLSDEKMRPGGIKVRCAKCKQIFIAEPPAPEPAPVEEEISFADLESSAPPPPAEESGPEDFDFGVLSEPEKAPDEEADEEKEFSFAGLDLEPQQDEEDFDLGGRAEAADEDLSGFGELSFDKTEEETEKPSEPSVDTELPAPDAAGKEDSFDFGELSFDEKEEASGGEEEEEEEGFVFADPDAADFSPEQPITDEDTASEGFSFAESREEEEEEEEDFSPLSFETQTEKADSAPVFPEEQSFDDEVEQDRMQEFVFSEQNEEEPQFTWEEEPSAEEAQEGSRKIHGDPFAAEAEPAEQTFGREEEENLEPAAEEEPAAASETAADRGAAPALDEKSAPITPAAPRRSPVASLMVFFLVVLLILTAVTGYLFWTEGPKAFENILSQFTGEAPRTPAEPVNRVEVTDQSGRFVVNRHAGELFVINGHVVNRYPEARSAIQVKGIVYNQQGRPVLQQTVFCGNPMDEETLRSLPFARIEERMNNQFGDNLSNLNVAPASSIPFTIVFRNLPDTMAEFTIEVVDSRPAAK